MRLTGVSMGVSLLALSACADLGFQDLPLATMPADATGPVQLAELETDSAVISPEPPADAFVMASTKPRTPRPSMSGRPVVDVAGAPSLPDPAPAIPATPADAETASTEIATPAPTPDPTPRPVTPAPVEQPEEELAMATPAPSDPEPVAPEQEPEIAAIDPEPDAPGPEDARPGQCFATIEIPAVTTSTTRQVLVTPATTKTETIPATYKTVTEEELIAPATTRTEVVPATYKTITREVPVEAADAEATDAAPAPDAGTTETEFETVTERVLVTPETTRTVEVPAVFENVTERVKVRDAYTEWRPGGKVYAIGAEALGGTVLANRVTSSGVMTLVEIPAEFENVTKRVLVTPATTREETVPAVFEEVTRRVPVDGSAAEETETTEDASTDAPAEGATRTVTVRVVDTPATVRTVPVPAQYRTVTRRVVDTPAMIRTIPVPAVYRDETVEEVVEPARSERVEVICEANAVPDFNRALQRALAARGFYDGAIDGIVGAQTRAAIKAFQDGSTEVLTVESARRLGLAIN